MNQTINPSAAIGRCESVRRASPPDADALAAMLVRAFDADPVMNYLFREDAQRARARRSFFELAVRIVLAQGEVWTTPERTGASLFMAPGHWQFGAWTELSSAMKMLRATSLVRAARSLRAFRKLKSAHPTVPHHYLFVLGVDPPHQGKGLGASLLAPMLARCELERMPAYLENSNPKNRWLYERHGFRVTQELQLGSGSPALELMWREANE